MMYFFTSIVMLNNFYFHFCPFESIIHVFSLWLNLAFVKPKNLKNLGKIAIVTSTNFATNLLGTVTKVLTSQNPKQNTDQH